jgi:hypothetical protein
MVSWQYYRSGLEGNIKMGLKEIGFKGWVVDGSG